MTETMIRPDTEREIERFDVEDVQESLFDIEAIPQPTVVAAETMPEIEDRRELSPASSLVMRAAKRISRVLERRAMNRAHSDGLKEYRERDHSDYVGHVASLADSDQATPEARAFAEKTLGREHRKADREEMIDKATTKVRSIGNSALGHLKNAGAVTAELAVGIGVRSSAALEPVKVGANKAADKAGESIMNGFQKLETGMDRVGDAMVNKVDSAKQTLADIQDVRRQNAARNDETLRTKEYTSYAEKMARKNERLKRKQVALERRAERRARWANNANALKNATVNTAVSGVESTKAAYGFSKDKANEMSERAKRQIRVTREVGRTAIDQRDS